MDPCPGLRRRIEVTQVNQSGDLKRENEVLRDRLSRLSEASLRINESLDVGTVLQGALDSARSLTGARYGVITHLDETGRIQDFLSSGMTAGEARQIWDTPDGLRIFEYLGSLSEPLRIPDLLGHLGSMELPEFRPPASVGDILSFLAAPVLHRGERVGNLFVADKEAGQEFTPEDSEILVMFASQAALVIANARRYQDERRARSDLETLINTSPVGVVVFDAKAGAPVSLNREAGRIVDGLREPGQSPEQLLEVIAVRRADGREVTLGKLHLVEALSQAETVRAEEIVIEVPDGRSVTVLVNATPIRSEEGEVDSFVVTLQDMEPLREQERLRAEFLAMVSHELRMPLTSIKGSAATVLGGSASMERAEVIQFFRIIDLQADRMQELIGGLVDVARIETGTLSIDPKPTDVYSLSQEAGRSIVSGRATNSIEIDLPADLPWVMADRGRIIDVLGKLLSNAARHSPGGSPIRITAERDGVHVAVSVTDEGRGISADLLPQLFRKFSRTDGVDQGSGIGGSGLGLAICKGIVEAHGGRIRAESDGPGLGARFTFTLPVVEVEAVAGPAVAVAPAAPLRPRSRDEVRILVVDDDPSTLRYVRDSLTRAGYSLIVTGDPQEVPALMEQEKPHLALLDLLLPGTYGIELMEAMLESADIPVIFLSVYGDEAVITRAFDMGATDYLVKPFSATELVARVKASLRRRTASEWISPPEPYSLGDLSIDYAARRVTVAGRAVDLTATEFELLQRLSTADGRVLTHDHLLQRIWSPGRKGEPWLVRNVVKRLRRKLGDDADSPTYIFTVPRVGYRMEKSHAGEGEPVS